MRVEDLLVELDGRPTSSVDDVQRTMTEAAIGRTMSIKVLRGDRLLELTIAPVELRPR